jgi:hypothetical protein
MEYPLRLPVPGSDHELVVDDYYRPDLRGALANLARVRGDGTDAWRAVPDTDSQDAWVDARIEDGVVQAWTWSGWLVTLDVETGQVLARTFVK